MRNIRDFETTGKPPISLRHLGELPTDARVVLKIRATVQEQLDQGQGLGTPVDDLIIEEQDPELRRLSAQVKNPLAFLLPTTPLRLLSALSTSGHLRSL